MSSIRERLLGNSSNNTSNNSTIRTRLGIKDDYRKNLSISNSNSINKSTNSVIDYKKKYEEEKEKRNQIQNKINKTFAEQGVQANADIFSTNRNILPTQQQSEITQNKKFEVYNDALSKNQEVEKKYQEIKKSDEYKNLEKQLIDQSNKVGYAKYDYDKAVVAEDDIGWYDKSIGNLLEGAKNIFDISGGLIKNDNGDVYYLPNRTELKHQKVQDSYDTKVGKLLGGAGYEIGRIGTSAIINQVLPGVGSTTYFGRLFMDSTNNAISEGYDSGSAMVYGAVNTGTEYLVGKVLGSATKKLTGGKTSGYEQLLNKTFNKILKKPLISKVLANAGSEATEEFVQEYLDNLMRLAILDKSTNANEYFSIFTDEEVFSDAVYSALIGAITGGTLGTVSSSDINVQNNDVINTFKEQLEETKRNTTNKQTIKKINSIIEKIDSSQNNINIQNNAAAKENINMPPVNKQENNNNNEIILPTVNDLVPNSINAKETTIQFNNKIENALTNKTSNGKTILGKVNNYVIEKVKAIFGIDITNKRHTISDYDIRHMINEHGNPEIEAKKGQIAITKDDIKNIPDIINNPTDIVKGTKHKMGDTIRYIKRYNDNTTYVVEVIPDNSNSLIIKTMWKKPSTLTNSNAPSSTSETQGSDVSSTTANNIPQSNQNVKSGILPVTNNMQSSENNAINMPSVENKIFPKDPTRAESYEEPEKLANILKERPVTQEEKDGLLSKIVAIKIADKGYYVDKLARQTKNRELSSKYDYMLMANGVAQQIIGNERFNPKTQKSEGNGLYKIFEPIENSGKLQEFSEYMYHKHNISRMSLNTLFQEENKPIFGDSISSDTSKNIVEKFESKNPEFIEWSQEIYDYNNFLLDILVDYGVISKEDKSYYNKKYPYYVPTIRTTDKTKVQMELIGKKASVNTPIKKAKGGNQDIIPLKEAMALRTMQTMNSALRNNFGAELLNTIESEAKSNKVNVDDVIGDDINVDDFLTKSTNKNPATLTIFKNGEKITFDISNEIYEALAPSKRYKNKMLNSISRVKRALTTEYNPSFMFTNPMKDIQDGAINSKHPTLFLGNIAEATKQIATKGDFYKLYLANGGSYETYFNYGEGYNKMPTKREMLDPRKILDKISQVNQYIEMTPRLAEFISSLEAGDSIETAMYNAQEITTNFKRGGDWTKNLDANGVTFLNASVQGTLKQIRNFQEAKSQGIKGMTNLAVKWSIAGLTPYILSQLIWGDDEEYEELSDYVKNNYYVLWKNEDGTFVRIPKGRVVSVIQNLFKQPLDTLKGEKIDIKEFVELLQNQILPSDPTESNIISPLLDVVQNKTWYGGDLVPQRLQSLPAEEQYDESTDSISIWLGQKLGISPIKINYILDQYSGAIGDMILPTLTLEAENDSNSFMSNLLAPMKDKFTTDSVMNNQNISDLYNLDDELTKKSKSSNATTEDILKSKYINSIQTEMNKLTAEKRNIQNDKTLTNNEKYKQVKEIQKQINQLAKKGLNNYEKLEVYDNYAKVGDKEYYKNSSSEWQKLDTTTTKYKIANQITTYDKYLKHQNEIDTIKDKYENTTQRKNAVINYVNSLNLSIPQKAMLIKLNYSSFDFYNKQIIEYINSQDLSKDEKTEILTKLGFTIKDGRVYY